LRPESGAEVRAIGGWMADHGITHVRLAWERNEPLNSNRQNLQARARAARYRLLAEWCAGRGILHLLIGHHQGDQAETLLLRLGRGSGVDGLAAMAPITEARDLRLLRPLLAFPRSRLEATLRKINQVWVDDPSNRNARFARVRLRELAPVLAAEGMTAERLAATAKLLRRARDTLEQTTAEFLVGAATPFAEGYVLLDRTALRSAPAEIASRAVARLVAAVGGLAYSPRRERTEALLASLLAPSRPPRAGTSDSVLGTLGGVLVVANAAGSLLFLREPSAVAPPITIDGPGAYFWDGRFRLTVRRSVVASRGETVVIGAMGAAGAREFMAKSKGGIGKYLDVLPRRVRETLPALLDSANRPITLANYGFLASYGRRAGDADSLGTGRWRMDAHFAPTLPLVGPGNANFSLV
ncbi:MAG: tRNA lysidine(34) synthetase TilS, partial [Methyloceanibacter sp.]